MKRAFAVSLILHLGILSGLLWWWSGRDEPRFFSVRVATVRAPAEPGRPELAGTPSKPQVRGQTSAPAVAVPTAETPPLPFRPDEAGPSEPAPETNASAPPLPPAGTAVVPAALAVEVEPVYPREARRRNWEGLVEVLVEVGADGTWRGGRVTGSSGHALLDEAALRSLRNAVFRPASRDGVPEAGTLTARVTFVLKDRP